MYVTCRAGSGTVCHTGISTSSASSKPCLHFFYEKYHTSMLLQRQYRAQCITDYMKMSAAVLSQEACMIFKSEGTRNRLSAGLYLEPLGKLPRPPGWIWEGNNHERKWIQRERRWKKTRCHTGTSFFPLPALMICTERQPLPASNLQHKNSVEYQQNIVLTKLKVVVEAPGIDISGVFGFCKCAVLSSPDVTEFDMSRFRSYSVWT